jgi:hypothetical protein
MAAAKAEHQTLSAWIRHTLRTAAERQMFDGTLHEAMRIVLLECESYTATTMELSVEVERRGPLHAQRWQCSQGKTNQCERKEFPWIV